MKTSHINQITYNSIKNIMIRYTLFFYNTYMNSSIDSTIDKIFCQLDITDMTLIRLILNQDYLLSIIKAFDDAIKFHANNKNSFYIQSYSFKTRKSI